MVHSVVRSGIQCYTESQRLNGKSCLRSGIGYGYHSPQCLVRAKPVSTVRMAGVASLKPGDRTEADEPPLLKVDLKEMRRSWPTENSENLSSQDQGSSSKPKVMPD